MSYPEDDRPQVSKLLRCKRYEQPPPGFFINFSEKVIARIEAGEAAEYSSWWGWLVERFDARPVLVCAYGFAVSALLFGGFRLSQAFEAEMAAGPNLGGGWLAAGPSSPLLPEVITQTEFARPVPASSLLSSRLVFREELGQFPPASGFRLQTAGFSLPSY